ncbi:MAG: 1-deoxy-D-xylulose-5-phosphate reductoisomerase [Firmicutes bacterium]|nr:1-deoxy-D-xylulose-5-phosphate reductoisomerase [Bacillota bacterium]
MKQVIILGSTGSIGTQALDVIRENPDMFCVYGLSCGAKVDLLLKQIEEFCPSVVAVSDDEKAEELKAMLRGKSVRILSGEEAQAEIVKEDCDIVLNSLMGMRGLVPTLNAIEAGHDIALANKETLVAGGALVMNAVKEKGIKLLPVDSEHSAIFQSLQGNEGNKIKKILLTASGGPFRGFSLDELAKVTPGDALKHPNWNMGQKITIDSATMMNKGLEVIEAKWLFDVDIDRIEVLVHPQSILHSAVEYEDTAIIGQMGVPDMKVPISYALGYPKRIYSDAESVDFFGKASELTFEKPDLNVFRCLDLAIESSKRGGTYPAVMNGANEVLVDLFLKEEIGFTDIQNTIEKVMDLHADSETVFSEDELTLERVLDADRWARKRVVEVLKGGER